MEVDGQDVFVRPKNPATKKKRSRKDSEISTATVESQGSTRSSVTNKRKRKNAYDPDEESR